MEKILLFLMPLAIAATAIFGGLIWGWYRWPELVERVHFLLSAHAALTFGFIALAVIGIDYLVISTRDLVGFRNVGQKSAAHDQLSRR